jgi:hypothetical protein
MPRSLGLSGFRLQRMHCASVSARFCSAGGFVGGEGQSSLVGEIHQTNLQVPEFRPVGADCCRRQRRTMFQFWGSGDQCW